MMLMRAIRNTFAHTLHEITFATDLIAEDCRKLKGRAETDKRSGGEKFAPKEPIDLFIASV